MEHINDLIQRWTILQYAIPAIFALLFWIFSQNRIHHYQNQKERLVKEEEAKKNTKIHSRILSGDSINLKSLKEEESKQTKTMGDQRKGNFNDGEVKGDLHQTYNEITEKVLSDSDLSLFLADVRAKSNGIKDVHFSIPMGANGNSKIMTQLRQLLSTNGFRVMDHVTQVMDPNQYVGNYDITIREGNVIEITIRQF